MTVRTNPPGAIVYVDNVEVGVSPVSRSFTYYGTSRIRLVCDGYETKTVVERIDPPVYDVIWVEPLTELLPIRFKDWREFTYDLERTQVVDPGEVIERAAVLRQDAKLASEQPAKEAVRLKPGGIPVYFDPEDPIWFQPE